MKKFQKKIRVFACLTVVSSMLLVTGCITTSGTVTESQHEAQMRTLGRAIAAALVMAKPESVPAARAYCLEIGTIEDALEAQGLIQTALSYLADDFVGSPALVEAVTDGLIAIGFDDAVLVQIAGGGISLDAIELPEMTEEVIENARLIKDGFCSMIQIAGIV